MYYNIGNSHVKGIITFVDLKCIILVKCLTAVLLLVVMLVIIRSSYLIDLSSKYLWENNTKADGECEECFDIVPLGECMNGKFCVCIILIIITIIFV